MEEQSNCRSDFCNEIVAANKTDDYVTPAHNTIQTVIPNAIYEYDYCTLLGGHVLQEKDCDANH